MSSGRLEQWQTLDFMGCTRLFGYVYERDAAEEGEEWITSELVKYHTVMGQMIAETQSGSMYQLGTPAEKDRTPKEIFTSLMDN